LASLLGIVNFMALAMLGATWIMLDKFGINCGRGAGPAVSGLGMVIERPFLKHL
jgi:hypothetical protein